MDRSLDFRDLLRAADEADMYGIIGDEPVQIFEDEVGPASDIETSSEKPPGRNDGIQASAGTAISSAAGSGSQPQRDAASDSRTQSTAEGTRGTGKTPSRQPDGDGDSVLVREVIRAAAAAASAEARDSQSHGETKSQHRVVTSPSPPKPKPPRRDSVSSVSEDDDVGLDDNDTDSLEGASHGRGDGGSSGLRKSMARLEVVANGPEPSVGPLRDGGAYIEDVFEDIPESPAPNPPQLQNSPPAPTRPIHPFFGGKRPPKFAPPPQAVNPRDRNGRPANKRADKTGKKSKPRTPSPLPQPREPKQSLRGSCSSSSSASSTSPSPRRRGRASSSSSTSSSSSASSWSSSSSSSASVSPTPHKSKAAVRQRAATKSSGGCPDSAQKKTAKSARLNKDDMVTASVKSVGDQVSVAVVPSGGRKTVKGGSSSAKGTLVPKTRKAIGGKCPRSLVGDGQTGFSTKAALARSPAPPRTPGDTPADVSATAGHGTAPIQVPKRASDAGPWPGSEPPPPGRVRYGAAGDHREALQEDPEVRYASERYVVGAGPAPLYVAEMGESGKQYDALVRLIYRGNCDPMSWMQNAKLSGADRALEQLCQLRFQSCRGGSGSSYITGSVARALPHVGDAMAAGNILWGLPHVVGAVAMSRRYDRSQKSFLLHSLRRAYAPLVFPEGAALVGRDAPGDVVDICRRVSEGLRRMRAAVESGAADDPEFRMDLRYTAPPKGHSSSPESSSTGSSSPGRSYASTATSSGYSSMSVSASEGPLPTITELCDACVLACDGVIAALMDGPGGPTRVADMLSGCESRDAPPPCPSHLLGRFRPLLASWIEDLRSLRDGLVISRVLGEDRSPRGIESRLAASRVVAAVASAIAPFLRFDCSRAGRRARSWDITTALFSERLEEGLKRVSDLFGHGSPSAVWPEKLIQKAAPPQPQHPLTAIRPPRGRPKTQTPSVPPSQAPALGLGPDAPTKVRRRRTIVAGAGYDANLGQTAWRRPAKSDPEAPSRNPSHSTAAEHRDRKRKSEDPCTSPRGARPLFESYSDDVVYSGAGEEDAVEILEDVSAAPRIRPQDPRTRRPADPRRPRPEVPRSIPPHGPAEADRPPPAKRRSDVVASASRAQAPRGMQRRMLTAVPEGGPDPRGGYRRVNNDYSHTPRPCLSPRTAYCDPNTTADLIDHPLFPKKWRHALMFDPSALYEIGGGRPGGGVNDWIVRHAAWMQQVADPEDVKAVIMFCPLPGEDLTGPVSGEKPPVWNEHKGGLSFLLSALSNRLCTRDSHTWAGNWTGPPNVSALNARGVLLLSTKDLGFPGAVEYLCLRAESARRKLVFLDAVDPQDWPKDGPTIGESHCYLRAKIDPSSQCCLRWPEERDLRRVVMSSAGVFGPGVFARLESLYRTLYPNEEPLRLCMGSNVTYTVSTRVDPKTIVPLSARDYRDSVLPRFDLCKNMSAQAAGLGLDEADFRGAETHGHRAVNRWGLGAPFRPIYVKQGRRRPIDHPLEIPDEVRQFCSEVLLVPDLSAGPCVVDPSLPPERLRLRLYHFAGQSVTWGPGDGPETTSINSQGRTELLPPPVPRSPSRSSSTVGMCSGSGPRLSISGASDHGGRTPSVSQKRAFEGGLRERLRRDTHPSPPDSAARLGDVRADYDPWHIRRGPYRPRAVSPSPFARGRWDEEEDDGGYYKDYGRYVVSSRRLLLARHRPPTRHHDYYSDEEAADNGSDYEDDAPLIASVQPAVEPRSRGPPPTGAYCQSSGSSSCAVRPIDAAEPVTVSDDDDSTSYEDEEGMASVTVQPPLSVASTKVCGTGNGGDIDEDATEDDGAVEVNAERVQKGQEYELGGVISDSEPGVEDDQGMEDDRESELED